MSEQRRGSEPDVYLMPPGAFRVGSQASPRPPDQPPAAPAPVSPAPRRRFRIWDIVLTVLLMLFAAAVSVVASIWALFLAMVSDGCGPANCDYGRMTAGVWVAFSGPWIVWVIGLVVAIVLLVLRRLAFWVPLAGIALTIAVWILGAWLATSSVG